MEDNNGFLINKYLTGEHKKLINDGVMVCSYNGVPYAPSRRIGTTTRIIDNSIRLLFRMKKVVVKDLPDTKKYDDGKELGIKIIARMCIEHHLKIDDFVEEKIGHYYVLSLKENTD